jgi:hypothetical protein
MTLISAIATYREELIAATAERACGASADGHASSRFFPERAENARNGIRGHTENGRSAPATPSRRA